MPKDLFSSQQVFFAASVNTDNLSETQLSALIKNFTGTSYHLNNINDREGALRACENLIQGILDDALTEQRALTKAEKTRINFLQKIYNTLHNYDNLFLTSFTSIGLG